MASWDRVLAGISGLCLLALAFRVGVFVPAALYIGPEQSGMSIPLMGVSAAAATLCVITAIRQLKRPRPGYMIASTILIFAFSVGIAIMLHGMISSAAQFGLLSSDYILGMRADTNNALMVGVYSIAGLLIIPLLRNLVIRPRLS
ncbi:hypothetical protein GCM10009069_19280 [Algimonas arctica]|uniref:Uncharacterized protein n=1 Tax=Algimonas arctica TaxID=1479486 RepID=A0A8J3G2L0_9PROT|nr:hypothetical protein [Algimonas arctica]GHA96392.1 hypothetical protein GCM10009069_19280 [Algimonas arctica]